MSIALKSDLFISKFGAGHVCEWDLSSGDVIEHKVHDGAVVFMALSGDRIIITCGDNVTRLFNLSTCLSVLL